MNDFGLDQDTVNGFLDEAGKHIATLNERLLGVEQGKTGSEIVAEMFRAAHSLKGAAGFLKLTDIAAVTHRMESVLDQVRHERLTFTGQVVETLFESFDIVSSLLAGVATGTGEKLDTTRVQARLDAVLSGAPAAVPPTSAPVAPIPVPVQVPAVTAVASDDPVEKHLGCLPDWLRGRLDEEDACEALVAHAGGEHLVAIRFTADDLLRFSKGAKAGMETLRAAVRVRRLVHLLGGPEDLWR